MKKSHEEIALQITATMVAVDELLEDLLSVTSEDNRDVRKKLHDKRGAIMADLAFYEGYHSALRAGRGTEIIKPAPFVAAHRPPGSHRSPRRNLNQQQQH